MTSGGGAELVFEAVERRELVEPVWGPDRHCRHQELTQEHNLDPGCSCSWRPTRGWGNLGSGAGEVQEVWGEVCESPVDLHGKTATPVTLVASQTPSRGSRPQPG